MRYCLVVVFLGGLTVSATADPLPFTNGRYVTNSELCFLSEEQMVDVYGDQVGWLTRTIDGASLSDGYELYCQVSDVGRDGKRITFKATCDSEGESNVIDGDYTWLSDDAFRVYGQVFGRCGSSASITRYEDMLDADTGELLTLYDDANERCRGGQGGNPRTVGACGEREEYGRMLESRRWCYGEFAEFEYQKFWAPCTASLGLSSSEGSHRKVAVEAEEVTSDSVDMVAPQKSPKKQLEATGDVGDNFTQTLMSKAVLNACEAGGVAIDPAAYHAIDEVVGKARALGLDPERMTLTSEVLAIDAFWLVIPTLPLMLTDPTERSKALDMCAGIERLTLVAAPLALNELETVDG